MVRRIRVFALASCFALAGLTGAAGVRPAIAQPAAEPPPLKQSLATFEALLKRVPNASIDMNFAEFRARLAVSKLQELALNWPAQSPADYRLNVDREVQLLQRALAASDNAKLTALLEALADDLEVKLEHCKASGGKLGGSVTVSVRTVQGDQESRNWQVFYLPKVLDAAGATSADRFPQLSSPTLETLVPGRYVMWVRDGNSDRTGERVIVKVGEGRKDLQLDLPVPSGTTR